MRNILSFSLALSLSPPPSSLFFTRIHAICVCDNADYFYGHIDETITELELSKESEGQPPLRSRDIIDIIEGYKGQGYGKSTDEELGVSSKMSTKLLLRENFPH